MSELKQRKTPQPVPVTPDDRPPKEITTTIDSTTESVANPGDNNSTHEQTSSTASNYPPGYNKHKRDIVKLVLLVVALALVKGDAGTATVLSVVSILCLKEGTIYSTKNLKWMALCVTSCMASLVSWYLVRSAHEHVQDGSITPDQAWLQRLCARVIRTCWAMTLGVFLASAYLHGHNSLLEFAQNNSNKEPLPPPQPRRDPPPKRYLTY